MSTTNPPKYLYKLVAFSSPDDPTPPVPLIIDDLFPTKLPVSELDSNEGFIHLSTGSQVPGTLRAFYQDHPRICVLRIPYSVVASNIKWDEPKIAVCGPRPGEGRFPHLYNGLRLGSAEIDSVRVWEARSDQQDVWAAGLDEAKAQNWLVVD